MMVPHDHLLRYEIVELADTEDVRLRIQKGYLLPQEVTNGRGDRIPSERDYHHNDR